MKVKLINKIRNIIISSQYNIIHYFITGWLVFFIPDELTKLLVNQKIIPDSFYWTNTIGMFLTSLICFFCMLIGIFKKIMEDDILFIILFPLFIISSLFLIGYFIFLNSYNLILMILTVGIEISILFVLDKIIKQ
jgi:hypothetical protein